MNAFSTSYYKGTRTLRIFGEDTAAIFVALPKLEEERADVDVVDIDIHSVEALASVPKLERLGIKITRLDSIIAIPTLEALEPYLVSVGFFKGWFDGKSVPLTADLLKLLARCKRLEVLDLDNVEFRDEDLALLESLHNLRTLKLPHVEGPGIDAITTNLRELSVSFNGAEEPLSAARIEHLTRFEHLEKCRLGFPKPAADALAPLGHLKKLRSITLKGSLTGEELDFLGELPVLEHLEIVSDAKLKKAPGLGKASSLVTLELDQTKYAPKVLLELEKLIELRSLRTLSKSANDVGLKGLVNHPNLRVLVVAGAKITDASADVLASIENLKALKLYSAKITLAGLKKLADLAPIEFSIQQIALGDAMLPVLKTLTSATFVGVVRCKLTKPARKELKAALPGFTDRNMGEFAHCQIERDDGKWMLRYPDGYLHEEGVIRTNPVHKSELA